jgi:hypothetical protein
MFEQSCPVLGELVDKNASVANSGSQKDPLFMYLGKSTYSLRVLELAGRSCLHKSSVSVDFFKQYCGVQILSARWDTWSAIHRMDPQKGR